MTRTVNAVYEKGVLRPLEPLDLAENEQVVVTIADGNVVGDTQAKNGTAPATPAEAELSDEEFDHLLDALASGPPVPPLPVDFNRADLYSDHD